MGSSRLGQAKDRTPTLAPQLSNEDLEKSANGPIGRDRHRARKELDKRAKAKAVRDELSNTVPVPAIDTHDKDLGQLVLEQVEANSKSEE